MQTPAPVTCQDITEEVCEVRIIFDDGYQFVVTWWLLPVHNHLLPLPSHEIQASINRGLQPAWFRWLDIIHCFVAARAVPLRQFLNRCCIEDLLCHGIDLLPDFAQGTPWRELTKIRVGQAFHGRSEEHTSE